MNVICLSGRLTKDPVVRWSGETAVLKSSLAVDRFVKGEKKADFPNFVCFGKNAELMEKYTHKGSKVGLIGSLQTGSYEKSDGTKVYTTEVLVDRIEFLDSKDSKSEDTPIDNVTPIDNLSGFEEITDEDIPF